MPSGDMGSFDLIVVGAGPAGAWAAYGARGRSILMLDAGADTPEPTGPRGNLYELRASQPDMFEHLIGEDFESLANLTNSKTNLKLKSPHTSYITRDWKSTSPVAGEGFEGAIAQSKGGLANAWGAGVYRFNDRDLRGFPIDEAALRPYYDELAAAIGVSGAIDDLAEYLEPDAGLQPPIELSGFYQTMLERYGKMRAAFHREQVFLGRSRLAVLTESKGTRSAYEYGNLEFFRADDTAIYSPAYTVDELIHEKAIDYRNSRLVTRFHETANGVEVYARNTATGMEETYRARRLLLAAGALNTARIVLASFCDYETRLPALDNPMACIPFFQLGRVGTKLEARGTSLAQLNLVAEDKDSGGTVHGSLYGTTGPLRSDIISSLPLPLRTSLVLTRYLAPAMGLMMLFWPAEPNASSYVRLQPGGELEAVFPCGKQRAFEDRLIRLLRRLGYSTSPRLIQRPGNGSGFHYAGMLPMRANPRRYETDRLGQLHGTQRVHIVDGACFPRLPAKNLTFTIMANALRIGRALKAEQA